MIFIFGLLLLLIPLLVIGILYPDDPSNRRVRTLRTLVTIFALSVTMGVGDFIAAAARNSLLNPLIIAAIAWISAVPLSAAERIAGLWRPYRGLPWACVGIAACLAWTGLLYLLSGGADPTLPRAIPIIQFILPGIVAGLAWYSFLPRRDPNVGQIFE